MPQVTIIDADGDEHAFSADEGESIMSVAVRNQISGLYAECGGAQTCGTCKVTLEPAWLDRLPAPSETEISLTDGAPPNTRLSCQIKMDAATDGIVVRVAESQY